MLSIIKKLFNRNKKSSCLTWAEREIAIAVERELEADRKEAEERGEKYDPKGFSYGGEIYKSAFRAYQSILKDGHSGFSWGLTKQVLVRLMENRPLSPLKGTDDEWVECGIENNDEKVYQNKRCPSVFKHVMPDGTVKIKDNDRVVSFDEEIECWHHFGFIDREVQEFLPPVVFPYLPPSKPYKVIDREFDHTKACPGCFDTIAILRIECPDGQTVEVNKFYKEVDNTFKPISKAEYEGRLAEYEAAKKGRQKA